MVSDILSSVLDGSFLTGRIKFGVGFKKPAVVTVLNYIENSNYLIVIKSIQVVNVSAPTVGDEPR